jgi:hypothetical protein
LGGRIKAVCVNTGQKFASEYVQNLMRNVVKYSPVPIEPHILTDKAGFTNLRTIPVSPKECLRSYWDKLMLFRPGAFERGDRIIFFDLDVLVCGSLAAMLECTEPFVIMRDGVRPHRFNSSVMMWTASEATEHYWTSWVAAGKPIARALEHTKGDQAWIEREMREGRAPMPAVWQDLLPGVVVPYYMAAPGKNADDTDTWTHLTEPGSASVVVLHGRPRFAEMEDGFWVKELWRG